MLSGLFLMAMDEKHKKKAKMKFPPAKTWVAPSSDQKFGFGYSQNGPDTSKLDEEISGYDAAREKIKVQIKQLQLSHQKLQNQPYLIVVFFGHPPRD